MRTREQWGFSEFVAAVTYAKPGVTSEGPFADALNDHSAASFVNISSRMHLQEEPEQHAAQLKNKEETTASEPSSPTGDAPLSDYVLVDDTSTQANPLDAATPEQQIAFVRGLTVAFPGLPEAFQSGYTLIPSSPEGNDAAKKFSAFPFPLLREKSETHSINQWHLIKQSYNPESESDLLNRALLATAYHFDAAHSRLIIRHAPIEITDDETTEKSKARIRTIQALIINSLALSADTTLQVEHIFPTIQPGRIARLTAHSRHIVIRTFSETYDPACITTLDFSTMRTNDPRHTLKSFLMLFKPDEYRSVGAQGFWNDRDCGPYAAVMATIAAKVLFECPTKNAMELEEKDFIQFGPLFDANKYFPRDFYALLNSLLTASYDESYAPPASVLQGLYQATQAFFTLGNSSGSGSSEEDLSALSKPKTPSTDETSRTSHGQPTFPSTPLSPNKEALPLPHLFGGRATISAPVTGQIEPQKGSDRVFGM